MTIQKLWIQIVDQLNLTLAEGKSYAFGLVNGVPVKVMYRPGRDKNLLEFTLLYQKPEIAQSLQQGIDRLSRVGSAKLRLDSEVHGEGRYVYTIAGSLFVNPSVQTLVTRFRAIADLINTLIPTPVACCSRCTANGMAIPLLINGSLCRLCDPCQLEIQENNRLEKERYEQKVIKPIPVLLAGLGLAIACALGWAVVSVVTGHMFGLVALGIGYGISAALLRVAGRGSRLVQGVGVAAVLLAVLLGHLFFTSYAVWQELSAAGITIDLELLTDTVRVVLADDLVSTFYSILFGLVGANGLLKATGAASLEMTIERILPSSPRLSIQKG